MEEAHEESAETSAEEGQEENGSKQGKTWYPYITKVQFEKFLSRLENKVPEQIDRDYVRAIIRTPSMIYRFLRGIEAMGLIDRDQQPTALLARVVDRPTRKYTLAEVIRNLYKELLPEWEQTDGNMSDDAIIDYFRDRTGMGRDSANKMKMFFKYLIGEADFGEPPETVQAADSAEDAAEDRDTPPEVEALMAATDLGALPQLEVEELRVASRSFPAGTTFSYDGFHPRAFRLLPDVALRALSWLYVLVEALGRFPVQVDLTQYVFVGKPKWGRRVIAIYTGPFRLWERARYPHARSWEQTNERAFFAAGAGGGAEATVWRQSVTAEAAVATGQGFAATLTDMASFYERFGHGRLAAEARAVGFPLILARVSIGMYRSRRIFSGKGVSFGMCYASKSIGQE